ncbi:unnamed protein product [Cyclocybe aegerita]|uniref:F-box domain-containing protein n=1 Tax=Cyclocybe aegerita TaxID=1973307 RepID=A0A8S0WIE3_CYCAE|nr:unnamed protein product [Cyclocybe aegerita]
MRGTICLISDCECFCSVSGVPPLHAATAVLDHLLPTYDPKSPDKSNVSQSASSTLVNGLLLDGDDVDSTAFFVAICPYRTADDGTIIPYTQADDDDPHILSVKKHPNDSNITEVFDVFPHHMASTGVYEDEDGVEYRSTPKGTALLVTYTSYLILKQAAPLVEPHMLYALGFPSDGRKTNGQLDGISYGPVDYISGNSPRWIQICSMDEHEDALAFWFHLLTQPGKTDSEILDAAWRGRGNLWAFVRPDRFPIAETLATPPLADYPCGDDDPNACPGGPPLDVILHICEFLPIHAIYAVLGTCKRVRAQVLPHVDGIARRRLVEDEPWFLPAGPFEFKKKSHGREEVDWWAREWGKGGIARKDLDMRIPWFLYRRECSRSLSMWNRRRIWGVARQIEDLARSKGLL